MSVLIPDDFFELDDQGEGVAQAAPLFNPLGVIQQVSTLLDAGAEPCPKNAGLFMYNPANGKSMTLPCKSRSCPACGKGWARNWQKRLGWNEYFHKDDKALTLTTAYDPGYKVFWKALFLFWRNLKNYCPMKKAKIDKETGEVLRPDVFLKVDDQGKRAWLPLRQKKLVPAGSVYRLVRPLRGKIEAYFGVVEYNQLHTQPHFHFVLRSDYIPQKIIKKCWQKAQAQAGFKKIAFDVRIEKIQSGVKQYFFKYITKLIGGKDELPRPENWQGRGVRYSRQFFEAPAPQVAAAVQLSTQQERDDYSKFYALHNRKAPMLYQKNDIDTLHTLEVEIVNQPWNPFQDADRAGQPEILGYSLQFVPFSWELLRTGPPC